MPTTQRAKVLRTPSGKPGGVFFYAQISPEGQIYAVFLPIYFVFSILVSGGEIDGKL